MSSLVDGLISKGKDCPWKLQCEIAKVGGCYHKGIFQQTDFSCASARGFDICNIPTDIEELCDE